MSSTSKQPTNNNHVDLADLVAQVLSFVPEQHREDALQQAYVAALSGKDPTDAILAYAQQEAAYEERELTQQAMSEEDLAFVLKVRRRMIKPLRKDREDVLVDWPDRPKEEPPEERDTSSRIYVRQIAKHLGVSHRWALTVMRRWEARYGITIVSEDPGKQFASLYITRDDFLLVVRHEPELSYARRKQRKKSPKVESLSEVYCGRCSSRRLKRNGSYPKRRRLYFVCLNCGAKFHCDVEISTWHSNHNVTLVGGCQ